jgi:hypothetical protein
MYKVSVHNQQESKILLKFYQNMNASSTNQGYFFVAFNANRRDWNSSNG